MMVIRIWMAGAVVATTPFGCTHGPKDRMTAQSIELGPLSRDETTRLERLAWDAVRFWQ